MKGLMNNTKEVTGSSQDSFVCSGSSPQEVVANGE